MPSPVYKESGDLSLLLFNGEQKDRPFPNSFAELLIPSLDELNLLINQIASNEEEILHKAQALKENILSFWANFSKSNPSSSASLGSEFGSEQEARVLQIVNSDETTFCRWGLVSSTKQEKLSYLRIDVHSHPMKKFHRWSAKIILHGNDLTITQSNLSFWQGKPVFQKEATLKF